eukprot:CAMPEP_0174348486 /NCGR_PEP_ID=MMETSP0811_2-20130205/4980_1 /TAXON_ID=73025 ORGANISM="Eutreptiella gymnastica-like, Strain CCMP1594" /NCGR_SAMPLE_ID=MMETSP0811_2 /ASSEMBLY_ACC=CAM_ASM_000667 /LENGTH=182 /DNA_ID=CAMNT_0015475077 /DNA_START=203 /DNA_END=748 /DNA_ORIENTATION=-
MSGLSWGLVRTGHTARQPRALRQSPKGQRGSRTGPTSSQIRSRPVLVALHRDAAEGPCASDLWCVHPAPPEGQGLGHTPARRSTQSGRRAPTQRGTPQNRTSGRGTETPRKRPAARGIGGVGDAEPSSEPDRAQHRRRSDGRGVGTAMPVAGLTAAGARGGAERSEPTHKCQGQCPAPSPPP